MNQASAIGFGPDASQLSGYAFAAGSRLGAVDVTVENTGNIDLYFRLRSYDGTTSPSGYVNIGGDHTIKARGAKTIPYNLLSQQVGIFGSGVAATVTVAGVSQYITSTTANVSFSIRNKGDLRGAQIDVVQVNRRNWGLDDAVNPASFRKKWGSVNTATGVITPSADPRQQ